MEKLFVFGLNVINKNKNNGGQKTLLSLSCRLSDSTLFTLHLSPIISELLQEQL